MTCCLFSSLKTLLTVTEDSVLTPAFNVLDDGLQLAGFQVTLTGRFWVTPEGGNHRVNVYNRARKGQRARRFVRCVCIPNRDLRRRVAVKQVQRCSSI